MVLLKFLANALYGVMGIFQLGFVYSHLSRHVIKCVTTDKDYHLLLYPLYEALVTGTIRRFTNVYNGGAISY